MKKQNARSYKSSVRQRQAQETRERIADAADALIKNQGYEKTSISAIALEAEVASQTVYSIFGSKQGLLMYILTRKMDIDYQGYKNEMYSELSPENLAERLAHIACKRSRNAYNTLSSFGGFALVYPELESLVAEHCRQRRAMFEEYLTRLDEKDRTELFAAKTDKNYKLELIVALTDGGFYHQLIGRANWTPALFEKILTRLLDEIVKFTDFE